jgi:ribulose 1,5-bisphosphate synthetase/thiazole synthase
VLIDLKYDGVGIGDWGGVADVCIVGAGPAGITLARRLIAAGRSVLLL